MKKIFSIIGAFLAGAMMFSCADQYDESAPLGTTISVNPTSLEMDGKAAPEKTVSITCDGMWMAQADEWITVEPMTGEGDTTVTVKVADNMDPAAPEELDAPRKGTITFAVGKENTIVVEVAQAGDPEKAAKKLPFEAPFKAEGQGKFKVENSESTTFSVWSYDDRYGMKASAYFDNANHAAESYLVSPVLDLTSESNAALTFDHAGRYWGADMAAEGAVVVREEGGKWGDALTIPQHATEGWTFVNSGEISLKDYVGKKVQVAFRYVSSNDAAATWEIDNVKFYNPDTTSGETPEPEPEPDPEPDPEVVTATISQITEAGNYKVENAIILASYARGFLLGDATGKILAYLGSDHGLTLVAGDGVTIEGTTSVYGGFAQFIAGSTLTKTGTAEVNHGEAEVLDGAGMDAYLTAPAIKYVSYTGTLSISGSYYNVAVEGTETAIGSISYPVEGLIDAALNGKKVVVTGYAIGVSSSKYVNTMALNVVEAEDSGEEPEPEIATSTFGAITAEGTYKVENATVVAVTTKGYLLYDTTGYAYVYAGSKTDYAVGAQMTVTGAVTYYYGMMQIAPSAVENVTTVEVTHPEAEVVDGAAIDAYMSAPTYKYVKVTGKLSVGSFTNLIVEGTTNIVSVSYFDGDLSSLNEKDVTLYGYLGGSNTKYSYATMYLVSYEEVAAEGGDDTTEGGRLYWGNEAFTDILENALAGSTDEVNVNNITTSMIPIEGKLTVSADGFTYDGLTYSLGSGGKFKFGTNQSVSDPEGDKETRLQIGGTGKIDSNTNIVSFEVPAAGTLKIDVVNSSKSEERTIAVSIDGTEVGRYTPVLQGTETTGEIFTVDCSTATAGSKICIYTIKSGVNLFSVEYTY